MNEYKEIEISKDEFRKIYFENIGMGWTEDYWNKFYKNEEGKKYFLTKPESKNKDRMMISSGDNSHRIFFLSEESEESFFNMNQI